MIPSVRTTTRRITAPGFVPRPARAARTGLLTATLAMLMLASLGCGETAHAGNNGNGRRLLVLGMDGLDPVLLTKLMDEGRLPNFRKLADSGTFMPLETSMPPQSPVAWSNFISGSHPGTHQIYDFIHRDPNPDPVKHAIFDIRPFQSTGDVVDVEPEGLSAYLPPQLSAGQWQIPLATTATVKSFRRGPNFWDGLIAAGISTTIYRLPAIYPPPVVKGRGTFKCICGMGTPDLMGGYGEYWIFSESGAISRGRVENEGGRFSRLVFDGDHAFATLIGPENMLRKPEPDPSDPSGKTLKHPPLSIPLDFIRDRESNSLQIVIAEEQNVVLKAGEWSDWVTLSFETGLPGSLMWSAAGAPTSIQTIVQFYVRSVNPTTHVYMSPMQIDPLNPVNPVSNPVEFATELAQRFGPYHTQGIPEMAKALEVGGVNEDEYLVLVQNMLDDRLPQYRAALAEFSEGLLFYYFGHTDQLAHIFWQDMAKGTKFADVMPKAYEDVDARLGEALATLDDDDAIIVLSDHGFSSFKREFHANTWLRDSGYQAWRGDSVAQRGQMGVMLGNLVWPQTKAYAFGINSIYLNMVGRERYGVVTEAERQAVLDEISAKLLQVRDEDGTQAIVRVYDVRKEFPGADPMLAPDLLIGYAHDYRGSWATALGFAGKTQFDDNKKFWRGDHCIAHYLVPGSLLTNLNVTVADPKLSDLAPSMLALFGVKAPSGMTGRTIFGDGGQLARIQH